MDGATDSAVNGVTAAAKGFSTTFVAAGTFGAPDFGVAGFRVAGFGAVGFGVAAFGAAVGFAGAAAFVAFDDALATTGDFKTLLSLAAASGQPVD